jgi:hypothetical protein
MQRWSRTRSPPLRWNAGARRWTTSIGATRAIPRPHLRAANVTGPARRISWGKPAKKKMTGSRGVPHRLNDEERMLYDMAHRKGFLEVGGSGWRKQRRGAPMLNTYRSSADARAAPLVVLHKSKSGEEDEVVLDLSPLRTPQHFADIARRCAEAHPGAKIEALELFEPADEDEAGAEEGGAAAAALGEEAVEKGELRDAFLTEPIYRLPQAGASPCAPRPARHALRSAAPPPRQRLTGRAAGSG